MVLYNNDYNGSIQRLLQLFYTIYYLQWFYTYCLQWFYTIVSINGSIKDCLYTIAISVAPSPQEHKLQLRGECSEPC